MRSKFLVLSSVFLSFVVLLSACSKTPVAERNQPETKTPTDASSKTAETNGATDAQSNANTSQASDSVSTNTGTSEAAATAEAKLAKKTEAAESGLADLDEQFSAAVKEWQAKFRAAKTAQARQAVRGESPLDEYAKKYLELAEKFAGTPVASKSLTIAMQRGKEETKLQASNQMLELAQMDSGTPQAEEMLLSIAADGDDESKLKASQVLADLVTEDPESEVAQRLAPQVLQIKGNSPGKEQVAEALLGRADKDIRSKKALEQLVNIASQTSGPTKTAALSRIGEHHLQSDSILDVIKTVTSSRQPDQAAEQWLKEICRKSPSATVKGTAAIALIDVLDRRENYRSFYSSADQETRSELDEDLLAYLDAEPDAGELDLIESTLDGYVSDNETLLETAKKKLFVVKYLSVGKVAPEITGADIDGVDFSLSEYRGKVVFLDFWGDW